MFPQLRLTICFARVSWSDVGSSNVACYLLMGETEAPTRALGDHENSTQECA